MRIILFIFSISGAAQASELFTQNYSLPTNKVNLTACYANASNLHIGLIEKQWLINNENHFFMQYEIQDKNNKIWLTICDLNNGQILKDQTIDAITGKNTTQ